ncbi:MAG: hypothetical protein KDE19_16350, partial [Caldilineaceae bacterium]|nr:hypothetical protein [Caldilineaceae bacterium]
MRRNARLATLLLVLLLTSCALYRPEKFVLEAIPPAITAFAGPALITTTVTLTRPVAATMTPQPLPTEQNEPVTDLRVLDEGSGAHVYLVEGTDVRRFNIGDDLVVYGEPNPGFEVAIAALKVVGKSNTTLVVQALLINPTFKIRTKMRVDEQLSHLSESQLVPVFDYVDGYLLRPTRIRLRPNHTLVVGAQLQALGYERIGEAIVDALPMEPPVQLQIISLGLDGQIARVKLLTGEWPMTGTVVSLLEPLGATPPLAAAAQPTVGVTVSAIPTATETRTPLPPTPTPTTLTNCTFAILVLDELTGEGIRGATVSVIVGTYQDTGVTDSDGYYRSQVPCQGSDLLDARVRVFADNHESHTSTVYLGDQTKEIFLAPIGVPTATATPIPRATATPTPPVAQFELGEWVEAAASSRLREYPGTTEVILETLPRNEIFRIDGGPREADGYQWWQLRELNGTVRGWIAYIDDPRDPSLLPVRQATPTAEATPMPAATPIPSGSTPKQSQPLLEIIKPKWGDSMSGPSEIRWRYSGQLDPNQGFDLMLWYEWDPIHRGI